MAGNGVSNNLYLGAANLNDLGSSPVKKKSPRDAYEAQEATQLDQVAADEDDGEDANKNTIIINKQPGIPGSGVNRAADKPMMDGNFANNIVMHDKFEYSSSGKKKTKSSFNSRTQMMFQGRLPNQRQPTNKARPKRQKTLPDQTYVQRSVKDHSVVMTSSLATMRQSSNLSARDDAQGDQEDVKDRDGAQLKRNKQYLHQMYRSNDEANEGPGGPRAIAVANMVYKQRAQTNAENVYQGLKQEWRRTAGVSKHKYKFSKD